MWHGSRASSPGRWARRGAQPRRTTRVARSRRPSSTRPRQSQLFAAPAAEIRALEDPAVRLVVQAVDDAALEKRTEAFNNAITRLRPLYVRGMLDWKKGTPYPDANLTLRFTYGEVKGYARATP